MSYTYEYPRPAVTADCVVFAYNGGQLNVLLIERGNDPYKGFWAFPGGFMNMDETAEECALRELNEETGLEISHIHEIGSFSTVDRDPRGRVVTIAFYTLLKQKAEVLGGDDAAKARWWAVDEVPPLAFDHDLMLRRALQCLHCDRESIKRRTTPEMITRLEPGQIFVFGSNIMGFHGGGAAYIAMKKFGAIYGQGDGLQGQSYAISSMEGLEKMSKHVDEFIHFASLHPELTFLVTRIGCGIAGYSPIEVSPLFINAVDMENIWLPQDFWDVLV